jgi:hypothetical protein
LNNDFSVAGFAGPRDRITWAVDIPQEGEYQAALLYNGENEVLRGNRFELIASPSNAVIRGELQERWWSPARPWVARHRLHLPLTLKRGRNRLSFHLTDVSEAPARLARGSRAPARGAQNRDFRLWPIELARPGALASIEKRARSLRSSNDWMVAGKYGLFTHFSPLTYPFHGGKMAFTSWQWGVDLFDVAAYADAVEKTGAKWVIFTTSHGMVFWPGPNRAGERPHVPSRPATRLGARAFKTRNSSLSVLSLRVDGSPLARSGGYERSKPHADVGEFRRSV